MIKYYCKNNCGNEISWQTFVRGKGTYQSCYIKTFVGKTNPNYKHGKTNNNKCLDCKKHINKNALRCKSCSHKGFLATWFGKHLTEEAKRKLSLAKGGTGIPYEFHDYPQEFFKIREFIIQKYKRICQLCNKRAKEVHHIDYNKKNSSENNLINFCHKCNCRVNHNRKHWYNYFRELIKR